MKFFKYNKFSYEVIKKRLFSTNSDILNSYNNYSKIETNVIKDERKTKKKNPAGFWKDLKNQREFMLDLGKKLNIKEWQDWYKVSYSDINENGGKMIVRLYGLSHIKTITTVFPEYNWEFWKFNKITQGYWLTVNNQRNFMLQLGKELGLKSWEDWYAVPWVDIAERGGRQILKLYNDSRIQTMKSIFPEHNWDESKFDLQQSTWTNVKDQKIFFDWLSVKLNIKEWPNDWYSVKSAAISENGGAGILNVYGKSHVKALMTIYPEYQWKEWKFNRTPKGTWNDKTKQREFFDQLEKKLGLKNWEDWYQVPRQQVVELGANGVLRHYGDSLWKALTAIYTEYPWNSEKFHQKEEGFWKDKTVQKQFFEKTAKKLGLTTLDDWYSVKRSQVLQLGGAFISAYYQGSLTRALKTIYPEHEWRDENQWRWGPKGSKSQNQLFNIIKDLFPNLEIFMDMPLEDLIQQKIENKLELDVVVPSLSLAFEYQGYQHYDDYNELTGSNLDRKRLDIKKREICKSHVITLIEVPYWWNGEKDTIINTILHHRIDLKEIIEKRNLIH